MDGRMKKKGIDINQISSSFKSLIFKMLCYDFNQRITIPELKEDPWFTGEGIKYSASKIRKRIATDYLNAIAERKKAKKEEEK